MAPDSAAADETMEPYVGGSSSPEDAEEYHEEEEEAPSHLPFAPSFEPCDTSPTATTVDPSYIISLIRQLLPRDKGKPDVIKDDRSGFSMEEKVVTEALVDIGSRGDSAEDYIDNIKRVAVDPNTSREEGTDIREHRQTELLGTEGPWEECGCILWDLSANKTHAEFMVDNLLLEVLLGNLQVSKSLRVTEICLGIIGNLACHDDLSSAIVSKNGLVEAVVQQLFLDDSTCLSETFRLLTAGLQCNKFASWAEALLPDEVLLRVIWIIGNTLNPVLMEKSIDFLLTITNNQEASSILLLPLIKLGLPYLMASLLAGELSKLGDESKLERSSFLDPILGLVEALSTTDNYSQLIISNGELLPLVCGVVKLPDKIEVANSCVSAIVILANFLVDEKHLALELSQDFSFLQGLLDILPFVSDDPQARSAFWCIMAMLLAQVHESDIGISTLQQFASLFADKYHHIEEDIESHPGEELGDNRSIPALRRIACILEKWSLEKSAVSKKSNDDSDDDSDGDNGSKVQRLLRCCRRYVRLK